MGAGHLREGDVDLMVRVIEDARHDDPGEAMPWALLDGLQRLVPCDVVSYQHHDIVGRCSLLLQDVDEDGGHHGPECCGPGEDDTFWDLFWSSSCSWPQRSGDLGTVTHWGDFFRTARERRGNPMREVLPEVEQELMLSLPAPPGHARRILFFRDRDVAFTERDRRVVTLLRPHVEEVWLDAERRRGEVPELTARQWEVLALVAGGLSHADVGRALHLSTGTVRTHMQHVRERLGVHSAAAAAALALPHAAGRGTIGP